MAIRIENTVLINVTLEAVSKAVLKMDESQFRAEKMYRISLSVAKTMLEKGIITRDEYLKMDTILLEKYHPVLGTLLAGKPWL